MYVKQNKKIILNMQCGHFSNNTPSDEDSKVIIIKNTHLEECVIHTREQSMTL
jgi:hypothetical protein